MATSLAVMRSSQVIFDDSIGRYVHTYLDIYQAERLRALLSALAHSLGLRSHITEVDLNEFPGAVRLTQTPTSTSGD